MSKFFNKKMITSFIAVIATSCNVGIFSNQDTYASDVTQGIYTVSEDFLDALQKLKDNSEIIAITEELTKSSENNFEKFKEHTKIVYGSIQNLFENMNKKIINNVNLNKKNEKIKDEIANINEKITNLNQTSDIKEIKKEDLDNAKNAVKKLNDKVEALSNEIVDCGFNVKDSQQSKPKLKIEEDSSSENVTKHEIDNLNSDFRSLEQYHKNVDVFTKTNNAELKSFIIKFYDLLSHQEKIFEKKNASFVAVKINDLFKSELFNSDNNKNNTDCVDFITMAYMSSNPEDVKLDDKNLKLEILEAEDSIKNLNNTEIPINGRVVFSNDIITFKYDQDMEKTVKKLLELIKAKLPDLSNLNNAEMEKIFNNLINYRIFFTGGLVNTADLQNGKDYIMRLVDQNGKTIIQEKYFPKFEAISEAEKSMATEFFVEFMKRRPYNESFIDSFHSFMIKK